MAKSLEELLAEIERKAKERMGKSPASNEAGATVYDGDATVPESAATVYEGDSTIPEDNATVYEAAAGPASEPSYARGKTLLDTYTVESDPIHGGMGSVWRVHHKGWNVDLAMKRPQDKMFRNEKQKESFIEECKAWINLGLHPNIVSCYYVREIDGEPTIFSEWMENGSLENHIQKGTLYIGTGQEQQERLLDIAIQFARGLHYAHEQGLIHQDVKPDNVLLSNDWDAKVADFGLAKARAQLTVLEGANTMLDAGATVMAPSGGYTPAYCSMEQMDGKPLTRRTDIYSWAVSVMEMYIGGRPWMNGVVAGLSCRDYFGETRIPMPEALKALLARCMASEPEDRPHDFAEIEAELQKIYKDTVGGGYPRPVPRAASDTAESLNNRALSLIDLNDVEEADLLLRQASSMAPDNFEIGLNSMIYRWRSGETDNTKVLEYINGIADVNRKNEYLESFYREQGRKGGGIDGLQEISAILSEENIYVKAKRYEDTLVLVSMRERAPASSDYFVYLQGFAISTGVELFQIPAKDVPNIHGCFHPSIGFRIVLSQDMKKMYLPDGTLWSIEAQLLLCRPGSIESVSADFRYVILPLETEEKEGDYRNFAVYDCDTMEVYKKFRHYAKYDSPSFFNDGFMYRLDMDKVRLCYFNGNKKTVRYKDSFNDRALNHDVIETDNANSEEWGTLIFKIGDYGYQFSQSHMSYTLKEQHGPQKLCTLKNVWNDESSRDFTISPPALYCKKQQQIIALSPTYRNRVLWHIIDLSERSYIPMKYTISRPESSWETKKRAYEEIDIRERFAAAVRNGNDPKKIAIYNETLEKSQTRFSSLLIDMEKELDVSCQREGIHSVCALSEAEYVSHKESENIRREGNKTTVKPFHQKKKGLVGYELKAENVLSFLYARNDPENKDSTYGLIIRRKDPSGAEIHAGVAMDAAYPSYCGVCAMSRDARYVILYRQDIADGGWKKIIFDTVELRELELPVREDETIVKNKVGGWTDAYGILTKAFTEDGRFYIELDDDAYFTVDLKHWTLHSAPAIADTNRGFLYRKREFDDSGILFVFSSHEEKPEEFFVISKYRAKTMELLAEMTVSHSDFLGNQVFWNAPKEMILNIHTFRVSDSMNMVSCASTTGMGLHILDLEKMTYGFVHTEKYIPTYSSKEYSFSTDGRMLACYVQLPDKWIILVVDCSACKIVNNIPIEVDHSDVKINRTVLLDGNRFAFVAYSNSTSELYDIENGKLLWKGDGESVSADGRYILGKSNMQYAVYWRYI